jgi:DNA-binding Lrp family transcriptional regulator
VTARELGEGMGVSTRSALDLLKRLVDEGLLREATGRSAWRAFVVEG